MKFILERAAMIFLGNIISAIPAIYIFEAIMHVRQNKQTEIEKKNNDLYNAHKKCFAYMVQHNKIFLKTNDHLLVLNFTRSFLNT